MDTRISAALDRSFARFEQRLSAGEERLGFKIAFNAPAIQAELGLPYSLVAGLTHKTLLQQSVYDLQGSKKYALEPEVAVVLERDLAASGSEEEAIAAIRHMAPAIEIVERDRPMSELPEVIAEGIYHRALRLGPTMATPVGASVAGMQAEVRYNGAAVAEIDAAQGTGHVPRVLLHMARLLERHGQRLQAGDTLILGTMCQPVAPVAGDRFSLHLAGQYGVEVGLR